MKSKAAILAALFAFAAFATATIGGFADTPALQNYGFLTSTGSVGVRNLTNQSTCTTTVSGGATKTITFEGEGNGPSTGSSYIAIPDTGTYSALNTTTFQGSTPSTTATADGLYVTPVAGLTGFRARVSSYGSGTVNITVFCTAGVLASTSTSSGGGGGSGATPIPYPTDTNGVLYDHPTGVPTFAPAPTPIPTPAGGVYPISGAPTPIATPAGGIYPISGAPTPIPWSLASPQPVALPTSFQSSFPTPIPFPSAFGAGAVTGLGATRHAVDTLTTNAVTAICSGACTAYDIAVINTTTAACYVQEFNTVATSVTLGTTAPVRIFYVPATAEAADSIPPTIGIAFATAWSYAVTTTATGSTACGSTVYVQADYK